MLPSTLKYLYSVEPVRMHFPAKQPCTNDTVCNAALNQSECIFPRNSRVRMILCAMLHSSIAHSIIRTRLFRGKMYSDWFNGIEILQSRSQHGEKVGYSYPSGLEKTLFEWEIYVPLVTKGLIALPDDGFNGRNM